MMGRRRAPDQQRIDTLNDEVFAQLSLQDPADLDELVDKTAQRLGKPIMLVPFTHGDLAECAQEAGITGAVVLLTDRVIISYNDNGGKIHRQNVIAHEIGHLWLGHVGADGIKCRTGFESPEEREAEGFARGLLRRAHGRARLTRSPHETDPVGVRRLGESLG